MATILLKPSAVASSLGLSKSLVYQLIRQGALASVRISKRAVRVRPEDLEAYIRTNTVGGPVAAPGSDSDKPDHRSFGS